MVFKTADGVEIIKTFSFKQGQYPIDVSYQVVNRSTQNWQGQMFGQIKRDNSDDPGKPLKVFSHLEPIWVALGVHQMSIITS